MGCYNHSACRQKALQEAKTICTEQEVKLTSIRKRVLELVWQTHKPVKAYDLLAQLQQEMPAAKPPTIYRALDFLMEQGLIHKLQKLNAFIGCHSPKDSGESCYFLICSLCEETQEMHHAPTRKTLGEGIRQHQFLAQQVTLEVEGICKSCLSGN